MIADTAIFSTSPWQMETSYNRDVSSLAHSPNISDMSIAALEAEIERVKYQSELAFEHMSCGTSVASSECSSEELYLETDNLFTSDTDSSDLLGRLVATDPDYGLGLQLDPLNWNDPTLALNEMFEQDASPPTTTTTTLTHTAISDKKSWSKLSSAEQSEALRDVVQVITQELGMREQLEILRLLDPTGSFSPTDTEFVVDWESLTDERYEQIQSYIKSHRNLVRDQEKKEEDSQDSTTSTPRKQQTKRQRKVQQKELRQRQRKEYRQMMKERRSGLFNKEEVLALSTGPAPSEEDSSSDIDILT